MIQENTELVVKMKKIIMVSQKITFQMAFQMLPMQW